MNINLAPEKGIMYALYIDRMVFQKYTKDQLTKDAYLEDKLLEMHLFDENKEYRYIKSRLKEIECVIDDSIEHEDKYVETTYIQSNLDEEVTSSSNRVNVVNYIQYNDEDLLTITNYRLQEVKS